MNKRGKCLNCHKYNMQNTISQTFGIRGALNACLVPQFMMCECGFEHKIVFRVEWTCNTLEGGLDRDE